MRILEYLGYFEKSVDTEELEKNYEILAQLNLGLRKVKDGW